MKQLIVNNEIYRIVVLYYSILNEPQPSPPTLKITLWTFDVIPNPIGKTPTFQQKSSHYDMSDL